MSGSSVFGVVAGAPEQPQVRLLAQPLPVVEELLALTGPVEPAEIFRFAAPCAGRACQHFDGARCQLAERAVQFLSPSADRLQFCPIRSRCRWWQQEGKAACLRCSQVVTSRREASPDYRRAATGEGTGTDAPLGDASPV